MSRTHTVAEGTMAQQLAPANEQLDLKVTASLSEILTESDRPVRKQVINTFMAGLNIQLVNQVKAHVYYSPQRPLMAEEEKKVDTFYERIDDENEKRNDAAFSDASGGKPAPMKPLDIAKQLAHIRAFCVQALFRIDSAREPRALWESVQFLLDQMPEKVSPSPALKVIALATKRSIEQVVAMQEAMFASDRDRLTKAAPTIISLAESLDDGSNMHDERLIEECFDKLPPIAQVNLFTTVCNAIVTAHTSAFRRLLRGQAAAAGDLTICEALYTRAVAYREQLLKKFAVQISEFEDNGSFIKELKRIS